MKKIAVIQLEFEAIQYDGSNIEEIKEFVATGKNQEDWDFNKPVEHKLYKWFDKIFGCKQSYNKKILEKTPNAFLVGHWAVKYQDGKIYNLTDDRFKSTFRVID